VVGKSRFDKYLIDSQKFAIFTLKKIKVQLPAGLFSFYCLSLP